VSADDPLPEQGPGGDRRRSSRSPRGGRDFAAVPRELAEHERGFAAGRGGRRGGRDREPCRRRDRGYRAAVWFDFFFTLPYERFTIRSSSDVTTFVLLLVVGVAVSQLAAYARRLKVIAITDAGYLAQIHETASLAQRARFPEAVVEHVREQLIGLLICRSAALSTGRCSVTRRGWSLTARCWLVMAAGMLRKRACPVRSWSCGRSATASTTASSC
jgi:hypothetical protein